MNSKLLWWINIQRSFLEYRTIFTVYVCESLILENVQVLHNANSDYSCHDFFL